MPLDADTAARLQARLDQIEDIIASGLKSASVEGNSSDFRDPTDLYRIRDELRAQLNPGRGRSRRTVIAHNSGFYPGGGPY